jgi:hypothetical protein
VATATVPAPIFVNATPVGVARPARSVGASLDSSGSFYRFQLSASSHATTMVFALAPTNAHVLLGGQEPLVRRVCVFN